MFTASLSVIMELAEHSPSPHSKVLKSSLKSTWWQSHWKVPGNSPIEKYLVTIPSYLSCFMFKLTHSHHQPPSPLPDMSCNGNKFSRLSGNFLNSNYKTKLLSEFHCCKIFMDEQMKHVIPKQQISQIAQTGYTNPTCSNLVYWWVWKANRLP